MDRIDLDRLKEQKTLTNAFTSPSHFSLLKNIKDGQGETTHMQGVQGVRAT